MVQIDAEFQKLIPPLSVEEFAQLTTNIKNEKNPDSIVLITWNGLLIDGHNRYDICQENNIPYKTVEKEFKDRDDVKVWIIRNQLGRRNINNYVKSRLALELEELFRKKAKENISKAVIESNIKRSEEIPSSQKSANLEHENCFDDFEPEEVVYEHEQSKIEPIDTREEIAKIANVSHDTISKVKKIEEKATPELKKDLESGTKSINEVYKEIKKEERQEERKQQQITKTAALPEDKFNVILADPPWRYDFSSTENREIENQYPTMELYDICNLKVPSDSDTILFMWTTAPKLREAFKVLDAWGFEYKTNAVWDKQKIGMGYYFRGQHEILLVATKGNPGTPEAAVRPSSVISEARTTHSTKPTIIYDLIEKMYPGRKYLEMFARNERAGWISWGNQV